MLNQDNFSAHKDSEVMEYLNNDCSTLVDFLPANQTHVLQAIDNNVGKILRDSIYKHWDEKEESLTNLELEKLSACDRRAMMMTFAGKAVTEFNESKTSMGMLEKE